MHVLISELTPDAARRGRPRRRRIRSDIQRRGPDGLQGLAGGGGAAAGQSRRTGQLSIAEEQGLLRIAQEALNNVAKHSGASEAAIRLRLRHPFSMEIEDHGQGFDVRTRTRSGPGIGLASMSERAAEIGWDLEVVSSRGMGTKVVVRRQRPEGGDV